MTQFCRSATPHHQHRLYLLEGLALRRILEMASFKGDLIQHQIFVVLLLRRIHLVDLKQEANYRYASSSCYDSHGKYCNNILAFGCICLYPSFLYISQQETEPSIVDELAASAAGRVAEIAIRIRRQLEGRNNNNDDGGTRRKRRRLSSRFQHERARLVFEIDYFSPTPVFNDRPFERIFQLTKTIVEHLIQICAKTDPFSTDIQDAGCRYCIAPVT